MTSLSRDMTLNVPASVAQTLCAATATRQDEIVRAAAEAVIEAEKPKDAFASIFAAPEFDRDAALRGWLDCEQVVAQILMRAAQPAEEFALRVDTAAHHIREARLREAGDIAAIERNAIA